MTSDDERLSSKPNDLWAILAQLTLLVIADPAPSSLLLLGLVPPALLKSLDLLTNQPMRSVARPKSSRTLLGEDPTGGLMAETRLKLSLAASSQTLPRWL